MSTSDCITSATIPASAAKGPPAVGAVVPPKSSSAAHEKDALEMSQTQPTHEKNEDASIDPEAAIIGEGRMQGARVLFTKTPPVGTRSLHSSPKIGATSTPIDDATSGSGSPIMAKMYLLNRRQNSFTGSLPSSRHPDALTTPVDPLLAPLDCPRPTPAAAPAAASSVSTDVAPVDQKNALDDWSALRSRLEGKQLVIFLDYDGTLTPIVNNPAAAIIDKQQRERLAKLAMKYPVAVVTGRKLETIKNFLGRGPPLAGLSSLYFAGSHGFDICCPSAMSSSSNKLVGEEFLPHLREFYERMRSELKDIPGAEVEDNRFSISVHYRNVESHEDREKLDQLVARALDKYRARGLLRQTQGKEVHEIRANFDWHKGAAVNYLMQLMCGDLRDPPLTTDGADLSRIVPIYVGDDVTDEDAFRTLRAYRNTQTHPEAIGIFVRKDDDARPSAASYVLRSPDEVGQIIERLARLAE